MTETSVASVSGADPARSADYLALLKPRVMSLVVFTAFTGLICARTPMSPTLAFVAVLGSADANAAPSYTLVSLAGAALGGVSMSGGRGSMLGAAAGGATMFLIQNLLGLAQVSVFTLQVVFGAALIVALALNSYADHRRRTGHLRRTRSGVR